MKKASKEAYELARHIHNWLHVHTLSIQSNSPHTIRTYSTTLSLFVEFLEGEKKINLCSLNSGCFSRDYIEGWILWLKEERGCSAQTCNIRFDGTEGFS